ncbi:hypothetical protein MPTK1_6g06570 [Marchantia polymorpha subsp. ruderalis]|uniref:Uncharacterized protein n=2 Tax=Marchantia polymorpha TaxID=3197 RepID=A0A176W237_MARPO|nr:hypothetical protein AXG93_900s1020 [Marchantia polymorpha subsp. ruderalis]PTQ28098.1 hypothetical protein MARPO_0173s0001 [Marchantia polymorpha]BBN13810.1 hypothetical protein Mp_6g06570 [Marchantia polymorpha subsp. ruderalis]|eukprot:PTQ28098.1 hypothetical protein MARPO_0173s0001 [Marchantia polymorpha]
MATQHDFHTGSKTAHAQGELLDATKQQQQHEASLGDAQMKAGDAAQDKAQETKEHAGNVFQKAGGAIQNAVGETVHEVQSKLGRADLKPKQPLED